MRIIIVGGGIGGLALAAGLRRHEFDVAVFDRDTDVTATAGYHITLDHATQTALGELVEPAIFTRLLASSSALRLRAPDAFWDRRGRLLGHGPNLEDDAGIDVDRVTLRVLLAEAAGESLHLGHTVTDIDHAPRAKFADGTSATGELLVGADGTHSLVANTLPVDPPTALPASSAFPAGLQPPTSAPRKASASVPDPDSRSVLEELRSTRGTSIRWATVPWTHHTCVRRLRPARPTSGERCSRIPPRPHPSAS
ncbi:NAD(P)-binding protein [Amycolatopsis sp. NPDC004378]